MRERLQKTILVRTDANSSVGGGHVMRCLTVADALKNEGSNVDFVFSDDTSENIIRNRGYNCHILSSDWQKIEDGANILWQLCDEIDDPVVLVDTYSITAPFVNQLKNHAKVCYLGSKSGDLGHLDLLVNYSFEINENEYQETYGKRGTKLLLGPAFSPLRPEFFEAYHDRNGEISRVLVTTGNTDPHGFAPKFLKCALADDRLASLQFSVVVGAMVDAKVVRSVEDISNGEQRVEVLRAVPNMALVMKKCDAAVSANGTTVYELAAAGVPTIVFAMVEEQKRGVDSFSHFNNAVYCGFLPSNEDGVVTSCVDALAELVNNPSKTAKIARCAHELIDGFGAQRIAKEVIAL